jgi:exopolysaccharide biosynthesis WecB/TagA/CpsF family protein
MDEAVAEIAGMVKERIPSCVATANVDFVVQARTDSHLAGILKRAQLVVCDGTPLIWLSRFLGRPLPERVAGSDLVPRLLQEAADRGWRVYFLGGAPQVLEAAMKNVQDRHPRLCIAGAESPAYAPLAEMDNKGICQRIRAARPDLLLVSFGCPKQEKWIDMNLHSTGVPVSIGVGATIDFLAGAKKRAPRWMQGMGLEWVFRLFQEPRRLARRYAVGLVVFAWAILRELVSSQNQSCSRS